MTTSTCELCGEVRDPERIDSGCIACNPEKARLAQLPEVVVVAGPPDGERIGCVQHHEVDCERCALLETRHRLEFDPHQQDETGSWVRKERIAPAYLPVIVLFLVLAALVGGCFWYFWTHLPR